MATLTSPILSTAEGEPPSFDAEAAKIAARDPSMADVIVFRSVTSHIMGVMRELVVPPLKIPEREVALTGIERPIQGHSMPVLPLDPITQIGRPPEGGACCSKAREGELGKIKLIATEVTIAATDLVELEKNDRLSQEE